MKKGEQSASTLLFIQLMTVIILLIAAVIFKNYGGDAYEECRLALANLIADRVGYNYIVTGDE